MVFMVYDYFRKMTPIFHLGSCVETEAWNETVTFSTFLHSASGGKTPFGCLTVYSVGQHTARVESAELRMIQAKERTARLL